MDEMSMRGTEGRSDDDLVEALETAVDEFDKAIIVAPGMRDVKGGRGQGAAASFDVTVELHVHPDGEDGVAVDVDRRSP